MKPPNEYRTALITELNSNRYYPTNELIDIVESSIKAQLRDKCIDAINNENWIPQRTMSEMVIKFRNIIDKVFNDD